MIDNKTTHFQLPLPHVTNELSDDCLRLQSALNMLDNTLKEQSDSNTSLGASNTHLNTSIATIRQQIAQINIGIAGINNDNAAMTNTLNQQQQEVAKITTLSKTMTALSGRIDKDPISFGYDEDRTYPPGALLYVENCWYEAYHPNGCAGVDPRDATTRPQGWQITDISVPYHWLKIGAYLNLPEIGTPLFLPATNLREGLIKYRSDATLHKDKYWRLAQMYPDLITNNTLTIADLRGEFLRGLDDGRGIDSGRSAGSAQEEDFYALSVQSQVGQAPDYNTTRNTIQTVTKDGETINVPGGHSSYHHKIGFAMENVENRPRNVAMLVGCRI